MANGTRNTGRGSAWLFVLIWLIIFLFDIKVRIRGGIPLHFPFLFVYLLLIFLARVLLLGESERRDTHHYIREFGIISLISFVAPMANMFFQYLPLNELTVAFVALIIAFSPAWAIYLGIVFNGERSRYTKWIGFVLFVFWIVATSLFFFQDIQALGFNAIYPGVYPPLAMEYVWDVMVDNAGDAGDFVGDQFTFMWDVFWGRIEYAIDPHKAKVDEMNKRKVGVFVEELKPIPTSIFTEGMPVSVEGRIKADVVDNEVTLKIDCEADNSIKGDLYPAKESWKVVRLFDERIDCNFPNLEPGSHKIKLNVNIENFKTLSYLRGFFLNQDTLFELRRQGKDPLKVYNFFSSDFIAVYTPGPLRVSMDVGNPPVGLESDGKASLKLDVGLTNVWSGQLKAIKEMFFVIPKGFTITGISGLHGEGRVIKKVTCLNLPQEDRTLCDDSLEKVYEITGEGLDVLPENLEGRPVVFSLRVEGDAEEILKDQPYTTNFFKTTVIYDYELSEKTQVVVKK